MTWIIDLSNDPFISFFQIWTAREAFAKMTARGLSIFDDEKICIDHEAGIVDYSGKKYGIKTIIRHEHVISVCGEDIENVSVQDIEAEYLST